MKIINFIKNIMKRYQEKKKIKEKIKKLKENDPFIYKH